MTVLWVGISSGVARTDVILDFLKQELGVTVGKNASKCEIKISTSTARNIVIKPYLFRALQCQARAGPWAWLVGLCRAIKGEY